MPIECRFTLTSRIVIEANASQRNPEVRSRKQSEEIPGLAFVLQIVADIAYEVECLLPASQSTEVPADCPFRNQRSSITVAQNALPLRQRSLVNVKRFIEPAETPHTDCDVVAQLK